MDPQSSAAARDASLTAPLSRQRRRLILIVAFAGVQALDVTGPGDVFGLADPDRRTYEIRCVAPESCVVTSNGLRLIPDADITSVPRHIDTLIVAGAAGNRGGMLDDALVDWVRRASAHARRVASVCTGAFLLARAGLLDGRRATTHWSACENLARSYPSVTVLADSIYVRDGNIYTSAGVTTGIDLALALVEEDLGSTVATRVARQLVLFLRRPGGQAQFSQGLSVPLASRSAIRELQHWIAFHLEEDLSVATLANRAAMSPRNFARVFAAEVGTTPAAYVEALRLERARLLLEDTDEQVDLIAARCGFGTVETLRRVFARNLGVSPVVYRQRFTHVP